MKNKTQGKSSLKLNSLLNIIFSASAVIISLVTYPYLTRVLKPAGIGTVSFAQSVISYFTLLAELGMPYYGMRAIARVKDDENKLKETVSELLSINITTHVIATITLAISVVTIPKLRECYPFFIILGAAMLVDSINPIWLFRGIEKYITITLLSIISKVLNLVGVFLFIRKQEDALIYAGIVAFCTAFCSVGNFIELKKELSNIPPLQKPKIMVHLKPAIVFFLMSCATIIYTHIDVIMLKFLKSETEVGYYDVGLKVKTILNSISASLMVVAMPRATGHWESGNQREAEIFVKKLLHVLYAIEFPLVAYFVVFSRPTVLFLGGEDYTDAVVPMIFIVLSVFAIAVENVLAGEVLIGQGKEKILLISYTSGLVLNFILNFLLINKYSVLGAALATLITENVVTAIPLIYSVIVLKLNLWDLKSLLWPIIGTSGALLSCAWILEFAMNPLLMLFISGCVFALIYLLIMLLLKDEIISDLWATALGILKKIFRKKSEC